MIILYWKGNAYLYAGCGPDRSGILFLVSANLRLCWSRMIRCSFIVTDLRLLWSRFNSTLADKVSMQLYDLTSERSQVGKIEMQKKVKRLQRSRRLGKLQKPKKDIADSRTRGAAESKRKLGLPQRRLGSTIKIMVMRIICRPRNGD